VKKHGNFSRAVEDLMSGNISGSGDAGAEAAVEADDREEAENPAPMLRRVGEGAVEAVITSDMVIKGTVTSSSNISIAGTILGDVGCEGDIAVRGKIEGNVTVQSLVLQAGTITGDIVSSGAVVVMESSTVNGNIKAERIEVNGKVVGNLDSSAKVILNQRAAIEGNITAEGLSITEGAELKGSVNVHKAE
jgi:cytoskeletal protein CcmA (bactofilin family)